MNKREIMSYLIFTGIIFFPFMAFSEPTLITLDVRSSDDTIKYIIYDYAKNAIEAQKDTCKLVDDDTALIIVRLCAVPVKERGNEPDELPLGICFASLVMENTSGCWIVTSFNVASVPWNEIKSKVEETIKNISN